jgi:hypothetical protein
VTSPVSSRRCGIDTRAPRRTTLRPRKRTAWHKPPLRLVAKLPRGTRGVRFCLYFAPRPGT